MRAYKPSFFFALNAIEKTIKVITFIFFSNVVHFFALHPIALDAKIFFDFLHFVVDILAQSDRIISVKRTKHPEREKERGIKMFTIVRTWNADRVRRMCIEHNFYTMGDCRAYDEMLNMVDGCRERMSRDLIENVAIDIANHTERQYFSQDANEDYKLNIENIIYLLLNEAIIYRVERDE